MHVAVMAPGRVNLIGEHTDYNMGFVLPVAIDFTLVLRGEQKRGRRIKARTDSFDGALSFSLDDLKSPGEHPSWIDYIKGVCWAMEKAGYPLAGADLSIASSIPIGAGLSSSAAIEVAAAVGFSRLNGYNIPLNKLALLCQEAENKFVGVRCGIMDQYTVAMARQDHALLLDCCSLEYDYIPLHLGVHRFLIVDSRVERSLSASAYNRRREECEAAVYKLSKLLGQTLRSLREVNLDQIKEVRPYLPALLYRRSRYVIEENVRVQEAASALREADLQAFGLLMGRSHAGLRDMYEVSCPELDLIVETATATPGVLGARMTGAGFGGCAVVLLEEAAVDEVSTRIREAFTGMKWKAPQFYSTTAATGVRVNDFV